MKDFFGQIASKTIAKPILWLMAPFIFIYMGIPAWIIGGEDAMVEFMDGWVNGV